jgi:hypothetical protein
MRYRHPDITPEMRARFRAQDRASDQQVFRECVLPALIYGLIAGGLYYVVMVVSIFTGDGPSCGFFCS